MANGNGDVEGLTGGVGDIFNAAVDRMDFLFHPEEVLDGLSQIPLTAAAVTVIVGALCVINGYRWHKWVVSLLALMAGLALGYKLSENMGKSNVIAVSIGALCAIIATPLLRVTVAIFGGLTGAVVGANTWTALDAPPEAHWAGGMIGFVLVAMASLVMFRLVVVLFTSFGGAAMVVLGTITLLLSVPEWQDDIRQNLTENNMLIPILTLVAGAGGFVLQQSRLRSEGVRVFGGEGGGGDGHGE